MTTTGPTGQDPEFQGAPGTAGDPPDSGTQEEQGETGTEDENESEDESEDESTDES